MTDVTALIAFINARVDEDAQAAQTAGAQFTREQLEADLRRERVIVAHRLLAEDLSITAHEDVVELLKLEARVYAPHREFEQAWIS
jgi:hypothetical protein